MKKVLAVLLAVCLLVSLAPSIGLTASAEEYKGWCGENVRWVVDTQTETLTISGTGAMPDNLSPWAIYDKNIKHLVIEPGITAVGKSSFSNMHLVDISIPETVEAIGNDGFKYNTTLVSCPIPESVTSIGDWAFARCRALRDATIPSGLTYLGESAFTECWELSGSITIPGSVKRVNSHVFNECGALSAVTIEEGIEDIGEYAFASCGSLTRLVVPSTVTSIERNAFAWCGNLKTAVLKGGKFIRRFAFTECSALEHVKLPDNLEEMDFEAFGHCPGLTRLDLPATARRISGSSANNVRHVIVPNPDTALEDYGFGQIGVTTYYGETPSKVRDFAISEGYDFAPLEEAPEDDWDPFATPTPEPTQTPEPTSTPTPEPTPSAPATWTPTPTPVTFTDVPANQYYFNSVTWAVGAGITGGTGGGKFSPNAKCTRAQIVTFLWNFKEKPAPESIATFSDMTSNTVFNNAISWAVAEGITGGIGNNKFGPGLSCTRGQAMVFLWNACGKPEPESIAAFSDMPSSSVFQKAISWGVEQKITGGTGNNKFSPNAPCTRAQIVTFLYAVRDL